MNMTIYLSINLFSTAGSWCSTLCVRSATGQPPSCKSGPSAGWIRHANLTSLKSGKKICQVASVMQIHQVGSVMQISHANQVQVQVGSVRLTSSGKSVCCSSHASVNMQIRLVVSCVRHANMPNKTVWLHRHADQPRMLAGWNEDMKLDVYLNYY